MIEELLEIDSQNVEITRKNLRVFDADLPDVIDEANRLYETFEHAYRTAASDSDDLEIIERVGQELGLQSREELVSLLGSTESGEPPVGAAKQAYHRMWSRRARGILILQTHKSYQFSVTDMYRLRVSSALGHLRPQIESAAQMAMVIHEPSVAHEWLSVKSDEDGRRYYNQHKDAIYRFRERHNLDFAWNQASGSSQHVRMASVASALRVISSPGDGNVGTEFQLSWQDVDPENPEGLFLRALTILRTQERLFSVMATNECLPECTDPILVDVRIPWYRQRVDRLFQRITEVFSEAAARWRAVDSADTEANFG